MQTCNPIFNQTFEFDLSKYMNNEEYNDLKKIGFTMTVLDWNPVEKCQVLGETFIDTNLLSKIFDNPNKVLISTLQILVNK